MPLLVVPFEFVLFGAMLVGIALMHRHALSVTFAGLAAVVLYEFFLSSFPHGTGASGLAAQIAAEWVALTNLALLLMGFAALSDHFEHSHLPDAVPTLLPANWMAGFVLLALVFIMSIFLDNIAGAVMGGVIAKRVYKGQVSTGLLVAIVAAANAGGAGSVIGDTTTTMMWLNGISPLQVAPAFVGAGAAFAVFGIIGALQQHRHAPNVKNDHVILPHVDWVRVMIVVFILVVLVATNVIGNGWLPNSYERAPWLGLAFWAAILASAAVRRPDWPVLRETAKGTAFLIGLVATAALMPIEGLPPPSWPATFGLGALSSVFDNIPLTALALKQGGYDWALLAFAVGFGGSVTWFGSSAGVALTNLYPGERSLFRWVCAGWHVPVSYVVGFFVLFAIRGWSP